MPTPISARRSRETWCRAFALCITLLLPAIASSQDPPPLELRPRVVPPPVPEVQSSCAECQPHADEHNRIAREINDLNFQLAHRRREVDLQRQAIAQVEAEIANLQSAASSAARDARMATARQRLDAYRAQLAGEQAKVAQLEKQIAAATAALAAARARLQACEETCARAAQPSAAEPPPAQAQPTPPQTANISPETRVDLRQLREDLTLSDEERDRRRREAEQFDASLKAMAGDEWAAEFAAFFTSTLFDTDTPFETAYLQNLKTRLAISEERTPEQRDALSASALQNVTVAAQRAEQQRAAAASAGRDLEYTYTRDARALIGPGYPDLPSAGDSHKTAALMTQDAHMGQLLQFRANLNTIKIGDGTVSTGSFVNLSGAQSFIRLSQINQEIGTLRATGGDEDRIGALEQERAELLVIDGLAPSDGLMTARAGLIDGLAGLSPSVYEAYWNWIGFKEGGMPEKYNKLPMDQATAQYQAELAQYENIYLGALGQSPFLGAMVDPTGSGDPIPFWQYLTSQESPWSSGHYPSSYAFVPTGTRDPAVDQTALTQAIDFLDEASTQVVDQYGTIVTTVPLLNAYGSPVFAPLRTQVINELSIIYPNITANMGLLTSQYDAYLAATAVSRMGKDLAIGGVQIVIGGVIFFFPFTAPVLVPVEIALTAGTVGIEGFRLYYAWQDLQQAEQAASVGAGASYVGVKPYQDLFNAQVVSFVVVAGTAPLATAGSLMSLEAANQLRLGAAVADAPPTGLTTSTDTIVDTVASTTAHATAPDFATFRGMRPDAQVAAVKGLPEEARGQLVGRLDPTEQKLFALAWESASTEAQIIALVRQGDMFRELIDGNWIPLSPATRNASDQEILARVRAGNLNPRRIILTPEGKQQLYEQGFGADIEGLSTAPPRSLEDDVLGLESFPTPGFYASKMSQAEIDALLAKTGPLTPEETALKADLLLWRRTPEYWEARMTQPEMDALFAKTGPLTPDEIALKEELIRVGFGPPLVFPGLNTPVTGPAAPPPPFWNSFNPLAEFGPAGAIDSEAGTLHGAADNAFDSSVGTVGGAGDSALQGGTELIPGRPRNPNRTVLLDEPELPTETIIFRPFIPPAAGLLDLPADLRRLLHGEPLPQSFWNVPTPTILRDPKPFVFEPHPPLTQASGAAPPVAANTADAAAPSGNTVPTIPLGTIVHFTPQPALPGVVKPTQPWVPPPWMPFVTKVIPIGCRFIAGSQVPTCDAPTYLFVLNYPPSEAGTIGAALRATPGFVYGEGDVLRFVQAPDPYLSSRGSWKQPYDDQWALKQIGLGAARDRKSTDVPMTVAVIDTGVAWNHVDLTPEDLWINRREVPANHKDDDRNGYIDDIVGWNFVDENNLPWDFNGHGTLVAGIIAAGRDNGVGIAGVNPGARIMVLKAMDERGRGRASAVTEAIMYAARQGARVINLSVGGRKLTRGEQLAIEHATAQGALVVVAAGNEGIDLSDYGPAGLRRALTVAATDPSDRRLPAVNFGAAIDIAAPGIDVLGPRALGTDLLAATRVKDYERGANVVGPDAGYIRATGTSFAAPLVAGVASLLFAANPSLSAAQVERMLLQSARDIEAPGVDPLTGYGRLDARAALAADPAFFVDASIARVAAATVGKEQVLEVFGTADADRLRGARLEYAAGENPSTWKRAAEELRAPVRDALLGRIPSSELRAAPVWTLRIVAVHAGGREREGRFRLTLK